MMPALPVNISYIPDSIAEMLRQSVLHLKLYYIPQRSSSCAEGKEEGRERRVCTMKGITAAGSVCGQLSTPCLTHTEIQYRSLKCTS